MHTDATSTSGPPTGAHIAPERLAALADETPAAAEARHLASCTACTREIEAYTALVAIARAERDGLGAPLIAWESLSAGLEDAGLIQTQPAIRSESSRRARIHHAVRQATAAALLLATGLAIGRLSATHALATIMAGKAAQQDSLGNSNATAVRLLNDTSQFQSRRDALNALAQAEARYGRAVAYLTQKDTGALKESEAGYLTRLAALGQVEQTTRAALVEAPYDPVLSQWYISTLGARQTTLQQLGRVLPVDEKRLQY
jgi:hypothetical protein